MFPASWFQVPAAKTSVYSRAPDSCQTADTWGDGRTGVHFFSFLNVLWIGRQNSTIPESPSGTTLNILFSAYCSYVAFACFLSVLHFVWHWTTVFSWKTGTPEANVSCPRFPDPLPSVLPSALYLPPCGRYKDPWVFLLNKIPFGESIHAPLRTH